MINSLRSRPVVLAGAIVFAMVLMVTLGRSDTVQAWLGNLASSATTLVILLVILIGTIWVDRVIVNSDRAFEQVNARYRVLLRAALVLSAVSFGTTAFGMMEFVRGSQVNLGDGFVGTFVSMGTTFGVQIILLFISLELGERLLKMRPRYDDELHAQPVGNNGSAAARARRWRNRVGMLIFLACVMSAMFAWGLLSVEDFTNFITEGKAPSGIWFGALILLIGVWALFISGAVQNGYALLTLVFLGIIYLGTLFVSSLFSFDSYYGIVQSTEDVVQRRGSILREETATMRREAGLSLTNMLQELETNPQAAAIHEEVKDGLDTLLQKSREFESQLQADIIASQQSQDATNAQLRERIAQLERERDEEINKALSVLGNRRALEEELTRLTAQRDDATEAFEVAKVERDGVLNEINTRLTLAACEEFGVAEGADCEGTTGVLDCGPECRRYKREAAELESIQLPRAERSLETAQANLTATSNAQEEQQVRLDATISEAAAPEGGISPAATRANAIRERYNGQIAALQEQILIVGPRGQDREDFDVESLARAYDVFRASPSSGNLQEYSLACSQIKNGLTRIGVQDAEVATFDCQPASMRIFASQADRIKAGLGRYETSCLEAPARPATEAEAGDEGAAGGLAQGSSANDDASLRALVDFTRQCLAVADLGQTEVRVMSAALTELESSYLTGRADLRSSINDLQRGNQFALGAAGAAIFVDILILVVGLLMAMNSPSALYENPLDPVPTKVEELLINISESLSPDGTPATAVRAFLSYVENRSIAAVPDTPTGIQVDQIYRATINERAVRGPDRPVVRALLNAIPVRYKREVPFVAIGSSPGTKSETRTAINESIIAFLTQIGFPRGSAGSGAEADSYESTAEDLFQAVHRFRKENSNDTGSEDSKGKAPKTPKPPAD